MSDNVTPISQHPGYRSAESESRANELRHRKREELRLQEVERACKKGRKGEPGRKQLRWKGDDRVLAARAIHELKEKLQRGDTERVKEIFPKIHRFSISPDVVDSSASKVLDEKKASLVVRPYLDAAKAIAEVGIAYGKDFDVTEFKLHVLRKTDLWNTWGKKFSADNKYPLLGDETAQQLAFLVERMVARIVRDTDLAKLFGRMRRVPGQWDICAETFKGTTSMACLFQTAYCEWFEHWSEVPPLPSVPLVRFWQAGLSLPEDSIFIDSAADNASASSAAKLSAEIHLYREVRFAIGPTVNAATIGPLFESRPQFELKIIGGSEEIVTTLELPDVLIESPAESLRLQIGETVYRVQKPENLTDLTWAPWDHSPLSTDKQRVESCYISWTPFDAAHISHWLGRDDAEISDFLALHHDQSSRLYVRGIPAHQLLSTIDNSALKTALESEIEKIKTAFETHEAEWREYLQERTAKLAAELDADQSPSS
jgi:hypothetical protein